MPEYSRYILYYDWIDEGGRVDRDTVATSDVKGVWPPILKRAVEVLTADEHPADPGDYCLYCPLRAECGPTAGVDMDEAADLFDERRFDVDRYEDVFWSWLLAILQCVRKFCTSTKPINCSGPFVERQCNNREIYYRVR